MQHKYFCLWKLNRNPQFSRPKTENNCENVIFRVVFLDIGVTDKSITRIFGLEKPC